MKKECLSITQIINQEKSVLRLDENKVETIKANQNARDKAFINEIKTCSSFKDLVNKYVIWIKYKIVPEAAAKKSNVGFLKGSFTAAFSSWINSDPHYQNIANQCFIDELKKKLPDINFEYSSNWSEIKISW